MVNFLKFCSILLFILTIQTISQPIVKFAAIGDYGKWYSPGEAMVSQMVHSWNPDFIITLGDNNYEYGADSTIDSNIGQFYHDYISPYSGVFGKGARFNKFFPSLGNHDWISDSARAYLNFFTLPGNERYYDYIKGNCHFFVIDSDINEPDGITSTSLQATWLKNKLAQSISRFKIVYFHHAPYTSGQHGNTVVMQWPFKEWGATVVLSGHEHNYERLVGDDGITYFVNGLGGHSWRTFGTIIPQSRFRFTANYGAMLITSYQDSINFKFFAYPDSLKDDTTIILLPIGIVQISEIVEGFKLEQNYPNPFNPVTKIRFNIPLLNGVSGGQGVLLIIYNSLGEQVAELVNQDLQPGTYEVNWPAPSGDAANFPSGVYFYKISVGNFSDVKKMLLVK